MRCEITTKISEDFSFLGFYEVMINFIKNIIMYYLK